RALGPPRLRDRLGRVLLRDLLRPPSPGRPGSRKQTGPHWLSPVGGLLESLEKIQLPGDALWIRGRGRGAAKEVPALPHLPRLGDELERPARVDCRVERRGPRGSEPAPL